METRYVLYDIFFSIIKIIVYLCCGFYQSKAEEYGKQQGAVLHAI